MVKQMPWYIHATEYYSPMKSNELLINNTSHVSLGSYNEGKKKVTPKGHIQHDFIYITFLKWLNFRNGESINGYQKVWSVGLGL